MTPKLSWQGRVYEDFEIGDLYEHLVGRTITTTDNSWLTLLTVNSNPIHFDQVYAAQTEFGKPLVDSTITLAIVTGLTVADLSRNGINLGWDEVRLPNPVFAGDTLYAQSEVLDMRVSQSRPHMGIVQFKTTGFNQDSRIVIEFKRTIMLYRRGHLPQTKRPSPSRK
jgi:itaconyl-CoA hydratase